MRLKNKGFSILMALGMTTFLLFVVTGIAMLYIREMRISRLGYDEIVASQISQGAFEYAMLKVKNHPDGFADAVSNDDADGKEFFTLKTPRSQQVKASYKIDSNSKEKKFVVASGKHLILPLFSAKEEEIESGKPSKKPNYNTGTTNVENLTVSGILPDQKWTIMATEKDTERSIGMTGSGIITPEKTGIIRQKYSDCRSTQDGHKLNTDLSVPNYNCDKFESQVPPPYKIEEIVFFRDETKNVADFLNQVKNPYLMYYNDSLSPVSVTVKSNTPFALPQYSVEARAGQKDTLQIFNFSEDKSKYLDELKYGVANMGGGN